MAEANGTVAISDPDALVKEIERTRKSLARTVDELADRVSPANVAHQALDRARSSSSVRRRGWPAGPSPPWLFLAWPPT